MRLQFLYRFGTGRIIMVTKPLTSRIDWVDYAKGICIVLVVMMHSTLGVEKAAGSVSWVHGFIDWAKPFRMPDFFMISGLFLASRIDKPWREYLDSKVVHFLYFYVLWLLIQTVFKACLICGIEGAIAASKVFLTGFVEPFGTLWFIYLLPIFFVLVKALRRVSPPVIFFGGALLLAAGIDTGWLIIDEFSSRFVFFYAGYWLSKYIFTFASEVDARPTYLIVTGLVIWGFANYAMVHAGLSVLPGLNLLLGLVGACAVVSMGVLLSKFKITASLRYLGQNSIVIYLSFFLFMATSRTILLKFLPDADLGFVSLIVTACGVIGPILLFFATRATKLSFLFHRPAWAKLAKPAQRWHSPNYVKQLHIKAR
jgi:uncharacterized membrane protein YcfT